MFRFDQFEGVIMTLVSRVRAAVSGVAAVALTMGSVAPAYAQANVGTRKDAAEERQKMQTELPVCPKVLGTIAIQEPEVKWWREIEGGELGSPEAVIRVFVQRSKCFTLVNRGRGLDAALKERELAGGGELRGRSNVGKGQMRAADYVIVPDIVTKNNNRSGSGFGAAIGGLLGGGIGAALGGAINIRRAAANVTLSIVDVRSTEEVVTEGNAKKSDLSFFGGGGGFGGWFGGVAGGGAYENTEIGQVIALAYLDAYRKMITELGGGSIVLPQGSQTQQAVTLTKPARMYTGPDLKTKVVRTLDAGMMLYPTGQKNGMLWEVEDELGNKGWVSSTLFQLSK
jgi:curli biogenesis system outer membrane secretion channel CsgG